MTFVTGEDPFRRFFMVGDRASVEAAEANGFRYAVDVDLQDEQLSLLVAEPDWVTVTDMDLDHVPGT